MPGGIGPPYRAPCNPGHPGVWPPPVIGIGGCYQHQRNGAKHVSKWTNITLVADWRIPTDPLYQPNGIPPYPRKSDAGCDIGNCGRDSCTDPPWPDGGDCPGVCGSPCHPDAIGEQKCDRWFPTEESFEPPEGLKACPGA